MDLAADVDLAVHVGALVYCNARLWPVCRAFSTTVLSLVSPKSILSREPHRINEGCVKILRSNKEFRLFYRHYLICLRRAWRELRLRCH